jgi:hypothetical protein
MGCNGIRHAQEVTYPEAQTIKSDGRFVLSQRQIVIVRRHDVGRWADAQVEGNSQIQGRSKVSEIV